MFKRKNTLIFIAATALVLAITNPTDNDFKKYLSTKEFETWREGRIAYFGIFSLYKVEVSEYSFVKPNWVYLGVFKNFILIKTSKTKKTEKDGVRSSKSYGDESRGHGGSGGYGSGGYGGGGY